MGDNVKLNIKLIQSNAYAALIVLVLLAILFMSFYSMMKPFAMTYNAFYNDSKYSGFLNQTSCDQSGGVWRDAACYALDERASNLLVKIRYYWLVAPIILAIGFILWLVTVATKKDPQDFYRGP